MVVFPNCKINLGLHVLRKRADGFHDLETAFYPLPLFDILELVAPEKGEPGSIHFTGSGRAIAGESANNLCVKAWQLVRKDHPQVSQGLLHLHKTIPMGAGLGGGSADASFTLQLINRVYQLGLSPEAMSGYALELGSDCPFFLVNEPSIAGGRGEQLTPVSIDLSRYQIVLVYPGIHVRTAQAFSQIIPREPAKPLAETLQQPVEAWKDALVNDFEPSVFRQFPEIRTIKESLYQAGAVYSSMSGSGSSVFGLFERDRPVNLQFPAAYFVKTLPAWKSG